MNVTNDLFHLTTRNRVTKASINLQKSHPFFAYLLLYMTITESSEANFCPEHGGLCVYPDGRMVYRKEFIDTLTNDELKGVLCHEVMHLVFLHLLRIQSRDMNLWNIATDLVINAILLENGLSLPKDGLIPENNSFSFQDEQNKTIIITNLNKKSADEVYYSFPISKNPQSGKSQTQSKNGKNKASSPGQINGKKGFDSHGLTDENGTETKDIEESRNQSMQSSWEDKMIEAAHYARNEGKTPLGMETYIEGIINPKVKWQTLLRKYVTKHIPADYTWMKRHKKSLAARTYFPEVVRDGISVVVGLDLSGSIQMKEKKVFLGELIGMSKEFSHSMTMRVLTHDIDVHDDYVINAPNMKKLTTMKLRGGGGTSHQPIFQYVKKNIPACKVFIAFTDGYSDLGSIQTTKYAFDSIFVVTKDGTVDQLKGKRFIQLN